VNLAIRRKETIMKSSLNDGFTLLYKQDGVVAIECNDTGQKIVFESDICGVGRVRVHVVGQDFSGNGGDYEEACKNLMKDIGDCPFTKTLKDRIQTALSNAVYELNWDSVDL
jgi:hypothetical protein